MLPVTSCQTFIHHSISAMIMLDENRMIVDANALFCQLFGYTKEEIIGKTPAFLLPDPDLDEHYRKYFFKVLDEEELRVELQYRNKVGELLWISLSGRSDIAENGERFVIWSFVNISKRVAYQQRLEQSNKELSFLFEHAHVGIIYTNHNIITKANPFFSRHFGYLPSMLEGNSIKTIFSNDALFEEGTVQEGLLESYDHPNAVYVRVSSHVIDEDKSVLWLITDLSKEHMQIEKLRHSSMYDSLIKIYNRKTFIQKVEEKLQKSRKCALLLLDIDFFKNINDTYGHIIGDKVLVSVVERVQTSLRKNDIIGRIGGEEFGIFLSHVKDNEAYYVAERIRESIQHHFHIKEALHVTASLGGCVIENVKQEFVFLYEKADIQLYEAKKKGRNRVEIISL